MLAFNAEVENQLIRKFSSRTVEQISAKMEKYQTSIQKFVAENGYISLAQFLVARNFPLLNPTDSGETLLHYAVQTPGNINMVRWVLEQNLSLSDKNELQWNVFHYLACFCRDEIILDLIFEQNFSSKDLFAYDINDEQPLIIALKTDNHLFLNRALSKLKSHIDAQESLYLWNLTKDQNNLMHLIVHYNAVHCADLCRKDPELQSMLNIPNSQGKLPLQLPQAKEKMDAFLSLQGWKNERVFSLMWQATKELKKAGIANNLMSEYIDPIEKEQKEKDAFLKGCRSSG
ncbi:MAG TPA: ankyrin repeat domain-containing protein [Gammaproteobacteria bacterium]|nr:ankyrin repeat domain-containing protein [Gammaproteobacteria bacterium]